MPDGLECPELFLKKQSEINQNADSPDTEKQDAENLHLEIQSIENQGQLNTYLSNTKESSMKELSSPAYDININPFDQFVRKQFGKWQNYREFIHWKN